GMLSQAVAAAPDARARAAALALTVRAAGQTGDGDLFSWATAAYRGLMSEHEPDGALFHPFAWREIQMRGLLSLGNHAGAVRHAEDIPAAPAPSPQWAVIERITTADALMTAGDDGPAEELLRIAVDDARGHYLPHQIQRVIRIARRAGLHDLLRHARDAIAPACSAAGDSPTAV
nr:XRE family transcriptional regulator [Actinomycetota bacterium]